MSKDDGGSAFPEIYTDEKNGVHDTYSAGGMTLRDYFAAAALPCVTAILLAEVASGTIKEENKKDATNYLARLSGELADAMISQRLK